MCPFFKMKLIYSKVLMYEFKLQALLSIKEETEFN